MGTLLTGTGSKANYEHSLASRFALVAERLLVDAAHGCPDVRAFTLATQRRPKLRKY